MGKAAKRLAVIYVILLSLCAPLMAVHFELFTWFMGVVDMSYWTQTVLWFLPMLVYGGILVILGIWNMVKSFQIYKRQDMLGCINGMLIHKYGLLFLCELYRTFSGIFHAHIWTGHGNEGTGTSCCSGLASVCTGDDRVECYYELACDPAWKYVQYTGDPGERPRR